MNLILVPWYIICATLAQTSALVITAFATIRYLLYATYVTIMGKEYSKDQVYMEMATGIMTYVPILAIVFGAYISKQHLVGFRDPLGCIFGPVRSTKVIGHRATEIYESYLELRRMGALEKDEDNGIGGFFAWLNKNQELWEDLILSPYRFFLNSRY